MFACAHPAIEESDPRALDAADDLRPRRGGDRFGLSRFARGDGPAPRAAPRRRSASPACRSRSLSGRTCLSGWAWSLEAIYAAFSHGWAEAFSDDPRGRNLAEEAIWLGRVVVALAAGEPEAMGLMALMLYAHSRRERVATAAGRYVPLSEQETSPWDRPAIEEAEGLLRRPALSHAPGRFQLEAAVQSVHAARRLSGDDRLGRHRVALRRALRPDRLSGRRRQSRRGGRACARARGGTGLLEEVGAQGGLAGFEPYWVAKADLCAKLGETGAARRAYGLAIGLQTDPAARAFLIERLAALG